MPGDGEVRADLDAPGPVACRAGGERPGPLGDGRRLHARGPQHRAGVVALTWPVRSRDGQAVGVDRRSRCVPCAARRPASLSVARPPWPPAPARRRPAARRRRRRAAPGRPPAGCGGTPPAASRVASSRICPASSTPVGPPPTSAKVSHRRRSAVVSGGLGHLERPEHPAPDGRARRRSSSCPAPTGRTRRARSRTAGRPRPRPGRRSGSAIRLAAGPRGDHPAPGDVDVRHLGEQAAHVAVPLGAGRAAAPRSAPRRGSPWRTGRAAAGRGGARARSTRVTATGDAPQRPGGEQPGEAASDDHDPCVLVLVSMASFSRRLVRRPGRARRLLLAAAHRPPSAPSCPARRRARAWRRPGRGRRHARPPRRSPGGRTANDRR